MTQTEMVDPSHQSRYTELAALASEWAKARS
jgi:hypothetical protein